MKILMFVVDRLKVLNNNHISLLSDIKQKDLEQINLKAILEVIDDILDELDYQLEFIKRK